MTGECKVEPPAQGQGGGDAAVPKSLCERIAGLGKSADKGFLTELSEVFNDNVTQTKKTLDTAMEELAKDASNPKTLAAYQAALAEYTLYRNAQSNAVKAYKDVDANTIRNFN